MSDETILQQLKDKLARALKHKAVLQERTKQQAQQLEDLRRREDQNDHVVSELLDRQREMNFMLYRANTVLHRIQEANAMLSTEFTELVKELPAPESSEWQDKVGKINDLFKRTGDLTDEVQDEIFQRGMGPERPPVKRTTVEIKREEPAKPIEPEIVAPETPVLEEPVVESVVQTMIPTVEAELMPEPEKQVASSDESEPIEAIQEVHDRLERLFGQTQTDEPVEPAEPTANKDKKPGVISKVWNKLRGSREESAKSEPETAESDTLNAVLSDAGDEVEHISFEIVTGGAEAQEEPLDDNTKRRLRIPKPGKQAGQG